jgi:hypothetical protein
MAPKAQQILDGLTRRVNGFNLRDTTQGMQDAIERLENSQRGLGEMVTRLGARVEDLVEQSAAGAAAHADIQERLAHAEDIRRFERDDIAGLRRQLADVRATREYAAVFEEQTPLVSVRIPAYRKTEELIDRAVASVLRQTYDRFEIIVVNDGPNERTAAAIAALGDSRIRYVEFAEQNWYPEDLHNRWMVAGAPGMNHGADLAAGSWIAPLDDDDEFSDDHIEKLLAAALENRAELSYGALIQKQLTHGVENMIWSDPPAISFMGALYMKPLTFLRYDEASWMVREPGDWNLIRRMSAAGVRMTAIHDVVGTMYSVSYTDK